MASVSSRGAYFDAGLDILGDLGYGGLKLAEVCTRLGVTTGSFYHYFENWSAYTRLLADHWLHSRTDFIDETIANEPDPRRRLDIFLERIANLPHEVESAIRVWSAIDADVRDAQAEIDRRRFEAVYQPARDLLGDPASARRFASLALFVLIGYELSTLPHRVEDLRSITGGLLRAMESGWLRSPDETD